MDLQRISDELEITALLNRYARAVDTKDWDLYRSVFTDDAHIDYSSAGAIAGTREQVAEVLGPLWGTHLVDINIALGNLVDLARLQSWAYELENWFGAR